MPIYPIFYVLKGDYKCFGSRGLGFWVKCFRDLGIQGWVLSLGFRPRVGDWVRRVEGGVDDVLLGTGLKSKVIQDETDNAFLGCKPWAPQPQILNP